MIAYSHRATQIITPAATIISINIVICNLMDYILSQILCQLVTLTTENDTLRRIPPLIALIISFFIIKPAVE
jgi:hypothetical protein